ncbi:MAG: DUF4955 domain-containing protein [Planctomycetota bacterium]
MPDYSYSGYRYGAESIPDIEGPVFDVTEFGAVPDDNRVDREAIQAAIDAASQAGGGVVFFPPGRFDLSGPESLEVVLWVKSSNVVLRGSGSGEEGTELFLEAPTLLTDPKKSWTNLPAVLIMPDIEPANSRTILEPKGKSKTTVTEDAKDGSFTLTVEDASGFSIGDVVSVAIETPEVNERFLDSLKLRDCWSRMHETGVVVNELKRIASIDGNTLSFEAPLMLDVFAAEGWSVIGREVLVNCGVEDIHFRGNFLEEFVHHKNYIHDNGYRGVTMDSVYASWIRRCRFSDMSGAATLGASLASAMLDCEYTGNPGHYFLSITFGSNNLIGRSIDRSGTFHGPGVSHMAAGSVVWRYIGLRQRGGIDFHATSPRRSLIDSCSSVELLSWGGNYSALPNHLDDLTFWNVSAENASNMGDRLHFWQLLEDQPDQKYGPLTAVKPNLVAVQIEQDLPIEGPTGVVVPAGKLDLPPSLYEYQIEQRIGYLPLWIGGDACCDGRH